MTNQFVESVLFGEVIYTRSSNMSNAFEAMMQNAGKESSTNPGGRPMHGYWDGFEKITQNGRIAAKCMLCSNVVTNTAKTRMEAHR